MSFIKTFIIGLLCSFSFFTYAQNPVSISGRIKDSQGPVTQASVVLKEISKGSVTDADGNYIIKNIKPGVYTLIISSIGYQPIQRTVTIKDEYSQVLNFTLKENTTEMQTVTVSGKNKIQEIKESGFSVNAIEAKQFANTTADLNQILNRSTGVRIREQGGLGSNFNFSINGLSGKAVKYFLDGVPMEILGSAMSLNNIPVNLAERIEVYKGVVPVDLGSDAMGGAVNVVTNQKTSNYLDLSHSYGSFNTHRSALNGQYTDKKTGLIFRGSAFYNYSDNNYIMKDVEILEGGIRNGNEITDFNGASFVKTDVRRFHDNYESKMAQLEAGLVNKKWADVFFIGGAYTDSYQDIQTGFDQNIVYGKVNRESEALSGFMRYKKNNLFIEGLNANLFISKSKDTYITTDTLFRQYYWDSYWTKKSVSEMASIKKVLYLVRPRTFARANLSYSINNNHSLNLNYTIDNLKNETYNYLYTDKDDMPGTLNKQIIGIAYQQEFFDKKLVNTFFSKYYVLGLERTKWINNNYVLLDTAFNNLGYGIATRYNIKPALGIKASFEHAYRLQEVEEMFGDGLNIQANPDLIPETSDNVNLGGFYNFILNKKHKFNIEVNSFYRNAKDFIYAVPDQRSGAVKNENKSSVRITGLEGDIRYIYADLFSLNINATYQNAINTTKFGGTESTTYEATYLNKIPNQPWFFGNADFSIWKNNFLGKGTKLQFNWFTQYVHWFYLTWEAFGNTNGKSNIPTQLVHNATLSYSLQDGRYNISAECRNLTDELAYDNFKLQKPGRAFSLKLRYFIK